MSSTCLILNDHDLCEKGGCIASISMVKLGSIETWERNFWSLEGGGAHKLEKRISKVWRHRNLRKKLLKFGGGAQKLEKQTSKVWRGGTETWETNFWRLKGAAQKLEKRISEVWRGQHRNLRNTFVRFGGGEQRNLRSVQWLVYGPDQPTHPFPFHTIYNSLHSWTS